jgi:hypothetical protein
MTHTHDLLYRHSYRPRWRPDQGAVLGLSRHAAGFCVSTPAPGIHQRCFAVQVRLESAETALYTSAFVIAQDWGSGLAFHPAARRPDFIRGLAFMEFIRPMPTWNDFHPDQIETFQKFRTSGVGEEMILEGNAFIEGAFLRRLFGN